jgi:hypothetical protein
VQDASKDVDEKSISCKLLQREILQVSIKMLQISNSKPNTALPHIFRFSRFAN